VKSCAFCHGENADGNGSEGKGLAIPPGDISAIRTARQYLHTILAGGVFDAITEGYSRTVMYTFSDLPEHVRWGLVKIINGKRSQ
jgi:hypothetical protein